MVDQIKVVMLGDSSVGKTSIVRRVVNDSFSPNTKPTELSDVNTLPLTMKEFPKPIIFQIWDTAGQEKYHSIASFYYKHVSAAIVVFDMTNEKSFDGAKKWISELKEVKPNTILILAGNKSDLSSSMTVDISDINEYANSISAKPFIVSAKENINIQDMFEKIALLLKDKILESIKKRELFLDDNSGKERLVSKSFTEKKEGCC